MFKKTNHFVIFIALFLGGIALLSFSKSPSLISTFSKPQTEIGTHSVSYAANQSSFGLRDEKIKPSTSDQGKTPYFFSQKMQVHKRYQASTSPSDPFQEIEQSISPQKPQNTSPIPNDFLKTPTQEEKKDLCKALSNTPSHSPFREALEDLNCPSTSLRDSTFVILNEVKDLLKINQGDSSTLSQNDKREDKPKLEEPFSVATEKLTKDIKILLSNCNDGTEPVTFENSPYKLNIGYFKTEEAAYIVVYSPDQTLLVYKIADKNLLSSKTSTYIDIANIPFEKVSDQNATTQCLLHSLSFKIEGEVINMN